MIIGCIAVIGCIIGILTFLKNNSTSTKKQAEEWGELKANIAHIKESIEEMRLSHEQIKKVQETATNRIYERMDEKFEEHLKHYHTSK